MNLSKFIGLLLALPFILSGRALLGIETDYRSLTIQNCQFEPKIIHVPHGKPFILTVDAFDDIEPTISAPELGINFLCISATKPSYSSIIANRILHGQNARLPLRPLQS